MTISALRQVTINNAAQSLWVAPDLVNPPSATNGAVANAGNGAVANAGVRHCPFCHSSMHPKQVESGQVSTCVPCEVIWLDRTAIQALPALPSAVPGHLVLENPRCTNCGAPVSNSPDGNCPFCGSALNEPTKVVLLPQSSYSGGGYAGGRNSGPGWDAAAKVGSSALKVVASLIGNWPWG